MQSAGDQTGQPQELTFEGGADDLAEYATWDDRRLSAAAIDRLGKRLRHVDVVTPQDLALLQQLRQEHFSVLTAVQSEIYERLPDVVQTSRLKTVQTIVDKLRRERTALSRMQDIAGIRIVDEMNSSRTGRSGVRRHGCCRRRKTRRQKEQATFRLQGRAPARAAGQSLGGDTGPDEDAGPVGSDRRTAG